MSAPDAPIDTTAPGRPPEFTHGAGFFGYRGLELVRGEGARLFDTADRVFWDLGASYGCGNVGHSHPRVVEAIHRQADRITYVSGTYANDARGEFVQGLLRHMPYGLDGVFLSNSGAESIEAALKMAMAVTERTGVVGLEGGFHGRTMGALAVTHKAEYREPFAGRLARTDWIPAFDATYIDKTINDETAAVVVEPIQGEAGVRPVPDEFLHAIRRRCDETGSLLVADEIQTGLHRTGPFLGIEASGVSPDIVCLAKSIAAGLPLGATVFQRAMGTLPEGMHGSTFGGNPLACAAGAAVLQVLDDERLGSASKGLGAHALMRLAECTASDKVVEVRGRGLMCGIELTDRVTPALKRLQNLGFLALPAGPTVLRLLPPLVLPREALDEGCDAIARILGVRS